MAGITFQVAKKTNSHISTLEIKAYRSNGDTVTVYVETYFEVGIIFAHCIFYSQLTIAQFLHSHFFLSLTVDKLF